MAIFTTLRVLKHNDEKACFTYFMISMEKNKEYFKIFSSEKRIISFKNLEINIKLDSYIQYIVLCKMLSFIVKSCSELLNVDI